MSEPPGLLFQNVDSQVIPYPEIFNLVCLMGEGGASRNMLFIKLHGDSEVPLQLNGLI